MYNICTNYYSHFTFWFLIQKYITTSTTEELNLLLKET